MTMPRGLRNVEISAITFRRYFSCHTCHPDGHVDRITYDIEPDRIGTDAVDKKT